MELIKQFKEIHERQDQISESRKHNNSYFHREIVSPSYRELRSFEKEAY